MELTPIFVEKFFLFLQNEHSCNNNTALKFVQRFRTVFNYVRSTGADIKIDPFVSFRFKTTKVVREVLTQEEIDLMFLDINMPHLSGLEFLESLEKPPLTIITTAYSEYALEGFRLHVVDYLMKPIAFQRFFQAVSKAQSLFRTQLILQNEHEEAVSNMYVRQGDAFQRIAWEDILYAEGMQNYVRLYFVDKVLTIHQTMASLEEMLPKDYFFRIHRSYLINICHIYKISGGQVSINGSYLPVAKPRREELLDTIVYRNLISK